MEALIVGGDRVSTYRDFLAQRGYESIHHWSGRRQSECHRSMPADLNLVVVLVDYVNHGLARSVKQMANRQKVPIIFSRRSVGQIDMELCQLQARS